MNHGGIKEQDCFHDSELVLHVRDTTDNHPVEGNTFSCCYVNFQKANIEKKYQLEYFEVQNNSFHHNDLSLLKDFNT